VRLLDSSSSQTPMNSSRTRTSSPTEAATMVTLETTAAPPMPTPMLVPPLHRMFFCSSSSSICFNIFSLDMFCLCYLLWHMINLISMILAIFCLLFLWIEYHGKLLISNTAHLKLSCQKPNWRFPCFLTSN
jgi:hypothetical protein